MKLAKHPLSREVAVEWARRLDGEGQVIQDCSICGLVRKRDVIRAQNEREEGEEENEQSGSTKNQKMIMQAELTGCLMSLLVRKMLIMLI